MEFDLNKFSFFVCDFDGVFTDNHVYLNEYGEEFVKCSRSDGYGIDILKSANEIKLSDLNIAILSLERNSVVKARAKKLNVPSFTRVKNKYVFLEKTYFPSFGIDADEGFSRLIYLGNDLNDLKVIQNAQISFAPIDSHSLVLNKATYVLDSKGGDGFVRQVIENILGVENVLTVLDHLESE
jgi:YrbI family 3-deoxy-D-manno-octulosonate 8-phosphate phosphatase